MKTNGIDHNVNAITHSSDQSLMLKFLSLHSELEILYYKTERKENYFLLQLW